MKSKDQFRIISATALARTPTKQIERWLRDRFKYIKVKYHNIRIAFELHPDGTGERLAELEQLAAENDQN